MNQWIRFAARGAKKIFFFYGADSVHLAPSDGNASRRRASEGGIFSRAVLNSKYLEAELDQSLQLESLWQYIRDNMTTYEREQKLAYAGGGGGGGGGGDTSSPPTAQTEPSSEENSTQPATGPVADRNTRDVSDPWKDPERVVIATALLGFSDAFYLGEDEDNIQGASTDACPDTNPYLQTTCGIRDAEVSFGDTVVSVEHMGLFRASETITFDRCVHYKSSASMIRRLWTGDERTDYSPNLKVLSAAETCFKSI